MNKKKIIKKAAINADLTVKEEQKAVEAFLCAVSDILKEGREVFLPDFGRFYVRKMCRAAGAQSPDRGDDDRPGNEAHTLQAFRKHHALHAQVWTLIRERQ